MEFLNRLWAILLALAIGVAPAAAQQEAVLPDDIKVVPPSESIEPAIAKFSGKWRGKWDGVMDHVLVVEQVGPDKVAAIYAYGAYEPWGYPKAGWSRVEGQFKRGRLVIEFPKSRATAEYRYEDGKLLADYRVGKIHSTATMVKQN